MRCCFIDQNNRPQTGFAMIFVILLQQRAWLFQNGVLTCSWLVLFCSGTHDNWCPSRAHFIKKLNLFLLHSLSLFLFKAFKIYQHFTHPIPLMFPSVNRLATRRYITCSLIEFVNSISPLIQLFLFLRNRMKLLHQLILIDPLLK